MWNINKMLLLICFSVFTYSQASVWDNLTANIAVVEYQPEVFDNLNGITFITNLVAYTGVLVLVKNETQNLDLIVFPESTLQNGIDNAVEVDVGRRWETANSSNLIDALSYVTYLQKTYMVINLVEKAKCDDGDQSKNCKNHNFHFYNTDVVFDRNGTLINKYRKYNLFGEKDLDKPETADEVVINTDFGVKLGIFTCFDILFKSPAQDLLKKNVDGVIFPTMWFSELPFLTALQTQQMWSQEHDITLIAAGANNPLRGSGGTGVFKGSKGAAVSGILAKGGIQPFMYKSTKGEITPQEAENIDVLAKDMDGFFLKTDKSVKDYKNLVLNTSAADFETQLCYENGTEIQFCCNFTINMSKKDAIPNKSLYTYHLVAYSGVRSFDDVYYGGIEVCGLLACPNSSLTSCGQRFPKYEEVDWPVTFEEITIKANFEKSENKTQFPNSLLSSIRPIDAIKTTWTSEDVEEGGKSLVLRTFSITEKQDRLLTFAVYGRKFEQDFAPPINDDDDDDDNNDDNNDNGSGKGAGNRIWGHNVWILFTCYIILSRFMTK